MNKKILMILSLIMVWFMSCGGGSSTVKNQANTVIEEPEWALNIPSDDQFYYFVGYKQDIGVVNEVQRMAYEDALAQAVEFIYQKVTVEFSQKTIGASGEGLKTYIDQSIKSEAKASLGGLETVDNKAIPFDDAGLKGYHVWVLTRISKSDVDKERMKIQKEIQRKLENIEKNIKAAEDAIAQGKVMDAVNSYVSAAISAAKVEERQDEISLYINQAGNILKNVFIEAVELNKSKVDIETESRIQFKVLYASQKGKIPVYGAQVIFTMKNNKGNYNRTAVSSKDGLVDCQITKLENVGSTTIYANLSAEFTELMNLGGEFAKHNMTLNGYAEKARSSVTFQAVSLEKYKIKSSVIALYVENGKYKQESLLTSSMLSYMLSKGYKVVKFPSGMNLQKISLLNDSELKKLANQGIKQVFVLYIDNTSAPSYLNSLNKWKAVYKVSAQLVNTSTGEIYFADNVSVTAVADKAEQVFGAFTKGAESKIKRLIDNM